MKNLPPNENMASTDKAVIVRVTPAHYMRLIKITRMFLVESDNLGFLLKHWAENGLQITGVMPFSRPVSLAVQIGRLTGNFIERCLSFLVVLSKPDIQRLDHSLRGLFLAVPDFIVFDKPSGLTREIPLKSKLTEVKLGAKETSRDFLDLHSVNLRYETGPGCDIDIVRSDVTFLRERLQDLVLTLIVNYGSFLDNQGKRDFENLEDQTHYISTWFQDIDKNPFVTVKTADRFSIKSQPPS